MDISAELHFGTPIYVGDRPDFLKSVKKVAKKNLKEIKKIQELDALYPAYMTGNIYADPDINEFSRFVADTAWQILDQQGYDLQNKVTVFSQMWAQEHHYQSLMEQHSHSNDSRITGFYFLDVPENSSRAIFYDPRIGKLHNQLPEKNITDLTAASSVINFTPKEGMIVFTNSWLAHSFTKHGGTKPFRFIHFNLSVENRQPDTNQPEVEVI